MRTSVGLKLVALFFAFALSSTASADQLECNSKADAERALKYLEKGALMIAYCSMCSDTVKVVRIESARVIKDCDYNVQVKGRIVAESRATIAGDGYSTFIDYKRSEAPFSQQIDLAYAYVDASSNDFVWLGGKLGLKAE